MTALAWLPLALAALAAPAGLASAAAEVPEAAVAVEAAPYLACKGTDVVKQASWIAMKNLVESWMDLDLKHARVLSRVYQAIDHNDAMEEHVQDCGFAVAVVLLGALRAIEYDHGRDVARGVYVYLQILLERLEPHRAAGAAAGWDINTTDLVIYPFLLGLEEPHDCYGTSLRFFIYSIEGWSPAENAERGVIHCQHGQWGLEALVPHWLRRGRCETEDPAKADYFVVPWNTWCERMVYRLNQSQVPVGDVSMLYLDLLERKDEFLPHWPRQQGRDHIFLFSDQGMNFFPEWRDHIAHSVFLTTEALTPGCGPSCFNPWKDVIMPGHVDHFRYRRMIEFNKPSDKRDLLFNFHGRHPRYGPSYYKDNVVRGKIVDIFEGVHGVSVGGFVDSYFEIMGSSHFCLVPMGTSSWTNHLYESFFAGCIPVILSDDFGVPFQGDIHWEEFSIKWPMSDVSMDLYHFLLNTPREKLQRMKALVDAHACWFDYHRLLEAAGEACSPYLGLIRALERKRPALAELPGAHALWGMQH